MRDPYEIHLTELKEYGGEVTIDRADVTSVTGKIKLVQEHGATMSCADPLNPDLTVETFISYWDIRGISSPGLPMLD